MRLTTLALAALLAALLAGSAFAKKGSPPELIVTARVTAITKGVPHCGYFYFATVIQYEVISVSHGSYKGPTLYAIHSCAEFFGPKLGEVHILELSKKRPADAAPPGMVKDKLGDPHLTRYWVTDAKRPAKP
jgi:hypothetical protein